MKKLNEENLNQIAGGQCDVQDSVSPLSKMKISGAKDSTCTLCSISEETDSDSMTPKGMVASAPLPEQWK